MNLRKYVRLLITQFHGIAPIALRASLVWTAVQVLIGDRLINSISSHHLFSENRLRVICAWSSSVRAAPFPCTRAIDSFTHTGYRSIIALTTLACTRADQSGHHLVMPFRRLFSTNTFPPHLSVFGHRTIMILGDRHMVGVVHRTYRFLTSSAFQIEFFFFLTT